MRRGSLAGAAALALLAAGGGGLPAGCAGGEHVRTGAPLPGAGRAVAVLRDAAGREVGRAAASDVGGGLRVTLDVAGLPPGRHGAHLHAVGRCDAPAFATAGGHWNPGERHHGSLNPAGPHAGDLPNLLVGADGRGTLGALVPGASLAALLDADGAAVIVHAGPDDLVSDPAGNSGGRLACGVLTPG